jgi:hypothetical protein
MADKNQTITSFKGFDKNLQCRGFQYEIGKTYHHEGEVKACGSGFHACEYPLDVFSYYAPSQSRFATVEQSGDLSRENDGDSKVSSRSITVKAEIDIPFLVKASVEYTTSKCEPVDKESPAFSDKDRGQAVATGDQSASSATGYKSASSATGNWSASSATGDQSASSATGYKSASSATGYKSASSATGDKSASSATGNWSASSATGNWSASTTTGHYSESQIIEKEDCFGVAVGVGYQNKARAPEGSAIVLAFRGDEGEIIHIRASKVGDNGVKANTWYQLSEDGEFVEAKEPQQ